MNTCCFTGHRTYKLGLNKEKQLQLKELIREQILFLINSGVNTFYTGMAEGIDLICAEIIIELRKKNNQLKLIGAIPFPEQSNNWKNSDRVLYKAVLESCDEQVLISPFYHNRCFHIRNQYMVDRSDIVLAVYNGSEGGTRYTVAYGKAQGKKLLIINPNNFQVELI